MTKLPPVAVDGHTPTTLHSVSASAAAAMHDLGCLFIDCRPPALHALERISGAICFAGPQAPVPAVRNTAHAVVLYDSGSESPDHAFSQAAKAMKILRTAIPGDIRLCLLAGGMPAVRREAAYLIDTTIVASEAVLDTMRRKLSTRPRWASRAFEALAHSAAPAAEILPWLYLGSHADARRLDRLESVCATHVLVVAAEIVPSFPEQFVYMHIRAHDSSTYPLEDDLPDACRFLEGVRKRFDASESVCVLVHCQAGLSRSASVVIAYLVACHGYSVEGARGMVDSRRCGICPDNFLPHLLRWEEKHRGHSKMFTVAPAQNTCDVIEQ